MASPHLLTRKSFGAWSSQHVPNCHANKWCIWHTNNLPEQQAHLLRFSRNYESINGVILYGYRLVKCNTDFLYNKIILKIPNKCHLYTKWPNMVSVYTSQLCNVPKWPTTCQIRSDNIENKFRYLCLFAANFTMPQHYVQVTNQMPNKVENKFCYLSCLGPHLHHHEKIYYSFKHKSDGCRFNT